MARYWLTVQHLDTLQAIQTYSVPINPSKTKRVILSLPIEVARRLEQLAAIERRSLSNYLSGLVFDHLESIPADKREQVKQRLIASTSFLEEQEATELQKYLEQNDW